MARGAHGNAGAHLPRLANTRAAPDAIFARLIADRDGRGMLGRGRRDNDRPAQQGRIVMLLHRREIGVEIEKEISQPVGIFE